MIQLQSCPICRKPLPLDSAEARKTFPFCSARCQQVDLFRWFDGRYAIVEPLTADHLEKAGVDPESFDPDAADAETP